MLKMCFIPHNIAVVTLGCQILCTSQMFWAIMSMFMCFHGFTYGKCMFFTSSLLITYLANLWKNFLFAVIILSKEIRILITVINAYMFFLSIIGGLCLFYFLSYKSIECIQADQMLGLKLNGTWCIEEYIW